jgi:hypothetical protein
VEEGGELTFIDEAELARVQHLVYYCDECCSYHVRDASANMGKFVALLNQEVESAA